MDSPTCAACSRCALRSTHTRTHATPFPPWREGKGRPGGRAGVRAIWAPGGRVPLSPTKQATMAVPEVGCPWLQRTVNSFKAYAVRQSWLNQFRQLSDTVESHILNQESETFSLGSDEAVSKQP